LGLKNENTGKILYQYRKVSFVYFLIFMLEKGERNTWGIEKVVVEPQSNHKKKRFLC